MVLLSGAPGTGKTLLGQVVLGRLPEAQASAFLTNSHLADRTALFQAILYDLGLPVRRAWRAGAAAAVDRSAAQELRRGKRTLLVVDEAQHLSADLLEELRLLTNLEAGSHKALQVVLIAQPSILDTLAQPALAALAATAGGALPDRAARHRRSVRLSAASSAASRRAAG